MPSALAAMVFLAAAYSGPASAAGDFPELSLDGPLPDGFVLRLEDGPDFYVWRCELLDAPKDSSPGFGIYFGLHPSPSEPGTDASYHSGSVVGESVRWAQWHDGQTHRRETVFDYRHSPKHLTLKLHVFVTARSEAELDALVQALAGLRLSIR